MCELAVDGTQIAVDSWEATQPDYVPTAKVLDHFEHEINSVVGAEEREKKDGGCKHVPLPSLISRPRR
jgi:nicotinamide mononucleotide adenylyltransferase